MPPSQIKRRSFSAEFKQAVVAECKQPGTSVSAVSIRHGINANLIQRWIKEFEAGVTWTGPGGHQLRKYLTRFKHSIVEQCLLPGAVTSTVALQNGLSPKVVQRWVSQERDKRMEFLPVHVDASEAETSGEEPLPCETWPAPVIEAVAETPRQAVALPRRKREIPAPSPTVAEPGQIDIEIGGARISLRGKADAATLRAILGALR